jgi:hypothetical protein
LPSDLEAYDELRIYTLTHGDLNFIHQHVVDAFAAQNTNVDDKPIRLTFALIGLYLFVEKGFTGRQVQLVHMKLAKTKQLWPSFLIPENRGEITVTDVVAAQAGVERDEMIHQWCVSVWEAYMLNMVTISDLLKKYKII